MKVIKRQMKERSARTSNRFQSLEAMLSKMKIGKSEEDIWNEFVSAVKEDNIVCLISSVQALQSSRMTTMPVWVIKEVGKHCSASTFELLYSMSMINMKTLFNTQVLLCLIEGISSNDNDELLTVVIKLISSIDGRTAFTNDQIYDLIAKFLMICIDNEAYKSLQVILITLQSIEDPRTKGLISEWLQYAMTNYNTRLITILVEVIKPMRTAPMCIEAA